jgi:hypothetical protein
MNIWFSSIAAPSYGTERLIAGPPVVNANLAGATASPASVARPGVTDATANAASIIGRWASSRSFSRSRSSSGGR